MYPNFIKASVLETAILSAVQKVSNMRLRIGRFHRRTETQWQTQETQASTDDKKELYAAEKRNVRSWMC